MMIVIYDYYIYIVEVTGAYSVNNAMYVDERVASNSKSSQGKYTMKV
jgi:hypothetical protein